MPAQPAPDAGRSPAHRARDRIRLVGPNSIGTVSTDPPVALTANAAFAVEHLRKGPLGRRQPERQPDRRAAVACRRARGIGFSRSISVGNEVDLAVGEIADLLVDDPGTDAILLFETLRDGERLARAARQAHAAGKPVIAYKLADPAIGQELARSHTGAIAGSDATFDAFCRRHGIARGDVQIAGRRAGAAGRSTQGAAARLSLPSPPRPAAVRAMVVDNMAVCRLDIADPPQALVDWLKPLGIAAGGGKLVDLTLAGAKPGNRRRTIERLLADPANDAVIFVVGSSAQFNPELAVEPLLRLPGRPSRSRCRSRRRRKSVALLTAAGVPVFRHPDPAPGDGRLPAAADTAASASARQSPRQPPLRRRSRPASSRLRRAACRCPVHGIGMPMAEVVVPDARRVAAAVDQVGGPVALKILSPISPTRPRRAVSRWSLPTASTPAVAAREMEKHVRARPQARLDGFLVQRWSAASPR